MQALQSGFPDYSYSVSMFTTISVTIQNHLEMVGAAVNGHSTVPQETIKQQKAPERG